MKAEFLKNNLIKQQLLGFEFIKHVRKPYVLILLGVFSVFNLLAIKAVTDYLKTAIYDHANYQKIYREKLKGPLTEDKVLYVIEETDRLQKLTEERTASTMIDPDSITGVNVYADSFLFEFDIYPDIKYAHTYYFESQDTVQKALQNIAVFQDVGNKFEQSKNEQIVSLFQSRNIPVFYNLRSMRYFVTYNFSWIFILTLGVLVIVPVFVNEYDTKMYQLLPTTIKGKLQLKRTKVFFTLLIATILTTWFSLLDFIGFAVFTPLEGFNAPLYALSEFMNTGFSLTVGAYLVIAFLCKLIAVSVFCMFTLFVSKITKNLIVAFVISLSSAVGIYLSRYFSRGSFSLLEFLNPAFLLNSRFPVMKYSVQNIFGNPVPSLYIGITAGLLLLLTLIWLTLFPFGKIKKVLNEIL